MKQFLIILHLTLLSSALFSQNWNQPTILNDREILEKLSKEGGNLIETGKYTKVSELAAQLQKAKKCKLNLLPYPEHPISDDKFYESVKHSVLVIAGIYKCSLCNNWHAAAASGYVIASSGVAVTNYHVINMNTNESRQALVAMTFDGSIYPIKEVLAASKTDDVAIVQLDGENLNLKALPIVANSPVGSKVRIISHPSELFYTMTEGIISRYYILPQSSGIGALMMAVTADYARGSSGGPALNDHGAVVGMVSSTASIYYDTTNGKKDNLQMVIKQCVPASSILKLIDN